MTTYEVSNLGRYGWMGGRGTSLQGQMGAISALQAAASIGDGDGEGDDGLPSHHGHSHGQKSRLTAGRTGFLMKLMGLDRFTQKRDREGLVKLTKDGNRNPFDLGCIGNCRDFWSTGREVRFISLIREHMLIISVL
jgi:palmitoyltransferase ZDHHC13/17